METYVTCSVKAAYHWLTAAAAAHGRGDGVETQLKTREEHEERQGHQEKRVGDRNKLMWKRHVFSTDIETKSCKYKQCAI